ncbi:MAG: LysR family transcriptional regulator [Selenomonadaceae bacterium]|nr:LysR family transcriptional regulator [Selenomonadaceae bacterium]
MELRTLNYFITVAKEASFTRAAAKIPITQPALTRAIQSLEEELGTKLFKREKYSVKLTTAGLEFFKDALKILSLARKVETKFAKGNIHGDVYIGCAESDAIKYFARAAKAVQEKYPDVRFNLYSGNFEDTYFRLDNGLLDFHITLQSVDIAKYNCLTLPAQDVWGVILRRDDPLAAKKFFTVKDLKELPLILSREALREEYPAAFGSDFEKFRVVATYNLLYNAAILAREGVGYPISLDKLINDAELCFRPLEPELRSSLNFIWRKDRLLTPQAQVLLEEMRNVR